MSLYIVPALLAFILLFALSKKCDVYIDFINGAQKGLRTVLNIFPSLLAVLIGVSMLRASGFLTALTGLLSPTLEKLGIPAETAPLLFVRPLSGSAALALCSDIIKSCGADSLAGRTAAVMMGSTETTFYTAAVYFGACRIKKTRYAIPAALTADMVGFITAAAAVRLFFY